jgi:hypothetical protein
MAGAFEHFSHFFLSGEPNGVEIRPSLMVDEALPVCGSSSLGNGPFKTPAFFS